jgi:hypothetical protein
MKRYILYNRLVETTPLVITLTLQTFLHGVQNAIPDDCLRRIHGGIRKSNEDVLKANVHDGNERVSAGSKLDERTESTVRWHDRSVLYRE